jgi:hypothetical protein
VSTSPRQGRPKLPQKKGGHVYSNNSGLSSLTLNLKTQSDRGQNLLTICRFTQNNWIIQSPDNRNFRQRHFSTLMIFRRRFRFLIFISKTTDWIVMKFFVEQDVVFLHLVKYFGKDSTNISRVILSGPYYPVAHFAPVSPTLSLSF